jgi:hypothetical protein
MPQTYPPIQISVPLRFRVVRRRATRRGIVAPVAEMLRLTITADVEIPPGGGNGTIICQGGRFGGWALYMKDGKPAYDYDFLGMERATVASPAALPPGKATIEFDFAYDGGGPGKGGTGTLSVNGTQVATGRIERTQPLIFSADDLRAGRAALVQSDQAGEHDGRIEHAQDVLDRGHRPGRMAEGGDVAVSGRRQ